MRKFFFLFFLLIFFPSSVISDSIFLSLKKIRLMLDTDQVLIMR